VLPDLLYKLPEKQLIIQEEAKGVDKAFSLLSIVRRQLLGDVHMVFNFLSLFFKHK